MLRLIGLAVVVGGGLYAANALGIYTPSILKDVDNAAKLEATGHNWLQNAKQWMEKASEKGGLSANLPASSSRFTDRVSAKHAS
ncbi:MAG: hypothetical protein H6922_04650 [Pseudomonadaceae bacterium]|nr:hypothetical protein [Pseudomonadaceae bacterium]